MMFDVGVTESYNEAGKACNWYYRVHDKVLSGFVLKKQLEKKLVFSVIPLFRQKLKDAILKHIEENEYIRAGLSEEKMREVREQRDELEDSTRL